MSMRTFILRRLVAFASAFVVLLSVATILAPTMRAGSSRYQNDFDKLVDSYFDFYFRFHPKEATAAGFHQYDDKLEDYSRAAREAESAKLRTLAARFEQHVAVGLFFDPSEGLI